MKKRTGEIVAAVVAVIAAVIGVTVYRARH
jgi:hypothetical protein